MNWNREEQAQPGTRKPTRKELEEAFKAWFDASDNPVAERHYLENHPLLLHPKGESALNSLSAQLYAEWQTSPQRLQSLGYDRKDIGQIDQKLSDVQTILRDIRRRGSTIEAIHDAYVDHYGIFALDLPFLAEQVHLFRQNIGANVEASATFSNLLSNLIEQATQTDGVPPEAVADLNFYFWLAQGPRLVGNTHQCEEAIRELSNALSTFTFERYPLRYATVQDLLGSIYYMSKADAEGIYLENAIACYQNTLKVYSVFTEEFTAIHNALARAYLERVQGNQKTNIEVAISYLKRSRDFSIPETNPQTYAEMLDLLGHAYVKRVAGKPELNAQYAVSYLKRALKMYAEQPASPEYMKTLYHLALASTKRSQGKRQNDIRQALLYVNEAIKFFTQEEHPREYRVLLGLLGELSRVISPPDIEKAIVCLEQTLHMPYPPDEFMDTDFRIHLGLAYLQREQGNRQRNIARAIEYLEKALHSSCLAPKSEEIATAQIALSIAYRDRLEGERRDNLERAANYYNAALETFTLETHPQEYAQMMVNLGITCSQRVMGERNSNLEEAILCFSRALQVYSRRKFPREYGTTQVYMGIAYSELLLGNPEERRKKAIVCFKNALTVYTLKQFPSEYAEIKNLLGTVYYDWENKGERTYLEQGIACLHESLSIFEEHGSSERIAWVQSNLGTAYRLHQTGEQRQNLHTAIDYFTRALEVYTIEDHPQGHSQTLMQLAAVNAELNQWADAQQMFHRAGMIEDAFVEQGAGIIGRDIILKGNMNATIYEGYALTRLARCKEGIVAVEHGRLHELATALALEKANAHRIQNTILRQQYEKARDDFIEISQILNDQMNHSFHFNPISLPSFMQESVHSLRENLSSTTELYHQAKTQLDAIITEVREAGDPSDFLTTDLDALKLVEAVTQRGQCHALVYLLATPWGGVALAAFSRDAYRQDSECFDVLDLPLMTSETILKLLIRQPDKRLDTSIAEGFALAQEWFSFLEPQEPTPPFTAWANGLRIVNKILKNTGILEQSAREVIAMPELRHLAKRPFHKLTDEERGQLESAFNKRYLHHTLKQSLDMLRTVAIRPLADWLKTQGVTHVLLVPCGRLVAFPLTAVAVTAEETFGDMFVTSIVPSAHLLLREADPLRTRQREGVYTIGDAEQHTRPLPWGEAEALTLSKIAQELSIPAEARVQQGATRSWVLEATQKGYVLDIAVHASFDRQQPLESRLVLANNEAITLHELLNGNIDLHGLRLLILSACQTAIADQRGVYEEVRSLAMGILQAGAQAALATLWSIDDRAAYLLIVRFAQEWFPHMREEPPAKALARAQQWLRLVTNDGLQKWRASIPIPDEDEFYKAGAVEEVYTTSRGERGSRYLAGYAEKHIRASARDENSNERPYADPIFWAAFQVIGY